MSQCEGLGSISQGYKIAEVFKQQCSLLDMLAAVYLKEINIKPDRAVLVQQSDGNTIRWWFEKKKGRVKMDKTMIIAEAGVNHNKSLNMAYALCDAAKTAEASAVKFQTWITDKIYPKDHPRYQMLKDLEMPFDFFRQIKKYCDDIGIMFLSTPDDEESLDFLVDELGMPIIKVGSGNLTNKSFLKMVADKNKPVILSTGMAEWLEICDAISVLYTHGKAPFNLSLLHCVSLYPTHYWEVNLKALEKLQYWNVPVGFSDHTTGIEIPIAAVAMGVSVIEKHLTIDRNLPGPDHKTSLEPDEFKQMVTSIRHVEDAMGTGIKQPCKRELLIRDSIRIKRA